MTAGKPRDDEEFSIIYEEAYVAAATVNCWNCGLPDEVICIYCESGTVLGEPLTKFMVSNIQAMDDVLRQQLLRWGTFREVKSATDATSYFANRCHQCGAVQDDQQLILEPGNPLFNIPCPAQGLMLIPLLRKVQASGDESFEL